MAVGVAAAQTPDPSDIATTSAAARIADICVISVVVLEAAVRLLLLLSERANEDRRLANSRTTHSRIRIFGTPYYVVGITAI